MKQKQSISGVKKGMNRDSNISQLQNIDYTFLMNGNTSNKIGDGFAIQNEPSNRYEVKFPDDYKVLGFIVDVLNNRTYYFLTNPITLRSLIGYVSNTIQEVYNNDTLNQCVDCSEYNELGIPLEQVIQTPHQNFNIIINDSCHVDATPSRPGLNFDINFPIKFPEIKIKNGNTLIYFNDYKNPPRWINVTDTSYLFLQEVSCDTDIELDCFDVDKLLQFPKYKQMVIIPEKVQTGGRLRLGTYEFYAVYCDILGNEITQYCTPTNPIKIFDENNYILEQTELDSRTNYAIKLKIDNLDTDFKYYKVVVVQRTNVSNTQAHFVEGIHPTTQNIVIYSSEDNKVRISEDVLSAIKPRIERAKGLEEADNKLVHWGVETRREINLQPVVNLMGGFLGWQSSIAKEGLYKSAVATSKYVGYSRNEVQPFSIRFNFKDGGFTPNFPLISRPASAFDKEILTSDTNKLSVEAYSPDCVKCNPDLYTIQNSGSLVLGSTYVINTILGSDNFSNVGFVTLGEPFIATQEIPTIWTNQTEVVNTNCENRNKRWQIYNTATEDDTCIDPTQGGVEVPEVVTKSCVIDPVYVIAAGSTTFDLNSNYVDLVSYIEENPDEVIPGITEHLLDENPIYTSGSLILGATYVINTILGSDNFSNVGFTTLGSNFIATNEIPTTWTNQTEVIKISDCKPNFGTVYTSGSLKVDTVYVINTILGSDNFSNVGFVTLGEPFIATQEIPTIWTNQTEVVKTTCGALTPGEYHNSISVVENETSTKTEIVFPDEYSKLKKPSTCFLYKTGNDGNHARNTEFEYLYMFLGTDFHEYKFYQKAYFRDFNFSNTECAYSEDIVNTSNANTNLQGYFQDYIGAVSIDSLKSNKSVSRVDVNLVFTNKIHKGALWFKGQTFGRQRFLLEVSKQNDPTDDDDIITDINNPQQNVRLTIYDKCSSSTELYSEIFSLTDGLQLFLTDLTSTGFTVNNGGFTTNVTSPITNGDFYVVVDAPIVTVLGKDTYSGATDDGQSGNIIQKYRTAPPDGCWSIATRDVEYSSITVSWDSISIKKTETYNSTCISLIPAVDDCDPIPYKKGKFAYWESIVKYPDNSELYNSSTLTIDIDDLVDLSNSQKDLFKEYYSDDNYTLDDRTNFTCKPIRHPKFPDNTVSPFIIDLGLPSFSESYVIPLGITLDNNVVKAFLKVAKTNQLLTKEEYNNIESYEIFKASNLANKSVIANGLAYDMYKYTEKGKDIHYANYPHNDLGKDQLHYTDTNRSTFIQHPFNSNSNNKYSFISPDLLLSREQLPTEVLLSGYQLGNSRGFITDVEDHPKWTILGGRARSLALTLAIAEVTLETIVKGAELTANQWFVGGTSFGASFGAIGAGIALGAYAIQGFVKVGQYRYEWLKIFRDLGAKNNFAEYMVSEGFHNKFLKNEDNTSYLRGISTAKYLKDARRYSIRDEKTGEHVIVNSFQRENSVFLSLGEFGLNYNREYIYNDNNNLNSDLSSRTISSANDCDNSEIVKNVGSPYLTLKNYIPDQYGEVDSIKWLTTNYINKLDNNSICETIFGGTYYISRFSYKRKMPFFTKTSFRLPDKTPFSYYDYQNIANPRFFCNYEEESNFSIIGIPFPDIDSSYVLDCKTPNNRMYIGKPSKFYLWYYGIASFLVESEINCNFRYGRKQPVDQFYPQAGDMVEWTQEKNLSIKEPNTFFYNDVYSLPVSDTPFKYLNRTFSFVEWEKKRKRENSVLISERDDSNGNELTDSWLVYKPLGFFDLPNKNGKLSFLKSIGSQQLLTVYNEQISVLGAIDTIKKETNNTVTELGKVGNLFEQRPIDIYNVGSGLSEILETPYGYFFVDEKRGKIVRYLGGDKIEIVSEQVGDKPSNMGQWFREHIPFKILKQIPKLDIDNKYRGIGFNLWYDDRQKRVFITKRDYVLAPNINSQDFNFNSKTKKLYYQQEIIVTFYNAALFKDVSWTISFKPEEGLWNSYFSFYPDYSPYHKNFFQVGYNWGAHKETLWNHTMNNSSFQVFQGVLEPFIIEFPIANENVNKTLNSMSLTVDAKRYQSNWDFSQWKDVGFNKLSIYNNTNHSGDLILHAQKTLSDTRKYPKTNQNNTQDILFTSLEGKHNINYFFNRTINQNTNIPLFLRDENNIFKQTNPKAVSFKGKRVNERLRGGTLIVKLTNDSESRFNILLENTIADETIYE